MVKFAPIPTLRSQAEPGNEGGATGTKQCHCERSAATACAGYRLLSILLVASAIGPSAAVAAGSETLDPGIYLRQEQMQQNAEQAEAYYKLGVLLEEAGQITEAIDHYRIAIDLNPMLAEAHVNLGAALASQGDLNGAIGVYRGALRLHPRLAEAHFNWGNALVAQDHMDEAIAHYQQAIALQPTHALAHYNLANALATKKRLSEAIAAWRQAIIVNPDFAEARANLGLTLYRQGDLVLARQTLQTARDLFQQQGKSRQVDRLNRILQQLNRVEVE
ncbi:MAG: tetratricopeptide repeat protein [Hormoscilla sp.]